MKKPLLQRKWVWVVIVLVILVGGSEIKSQFENNRQDKVVAEATKNADKVLAGKVEIPDPYFKSKEEVENLFQQADLTADFVVVNFDKKADTNQRAIKIGDCDQLDADQPNVTYYGDKEVGEKYGFYADEGSNIIIGYTDHDYDGSRQKDNSSETKESSETISSSTAEEPRNITENLAMDTNEAFINHLSNLQVLEVNGIYIEDGNYTTQITLESAGSLKSAINQVAQAVRLLSDTDLSQFSNVGISVKTILSDNELGFVVKSDWDPAFINSEKAKITQNKNVADFARSWWQIEE
ncbi:hypothetical protein [Enterococcus timonensis]|uniref:hypothetical protein n=1 Tax=Enterococcus timonensis TaxID=1852364 RepID=UPI0008DA0869|nr:hypothetical protein [Enterococcus timonensis]